MKHTWLLAQIALFTILGACARHPGLDINSVDGHVRRHSTSSHPKAALNSPPGTSAGSDPQASPQAAVLRASLNLNYFPQLVDHFGALPGQTFRQRYWVDSSAATGSESPVLLHICGEGDVEKGYFLNDNAIAWAKALGAHIVYVEHRYYGKSLPFQELTTDNLQYLTLENELEDLAAIERALIPKFGLKSKWISLGGSYSGTLSALYRQRHPELSVGALASSAPMISGLGASTGNQDDVDELSSTETAKDTGDRQWAYQACSSLGYWIADGGSITSNLFRPSTWLCQQIFGMVASADTSAYNAKYSLPFVSQATNSPSNILFTYGDQDVWSKTGLSQLTNQNSKIEISVIPGAGHHFDLNKPGFMDSREVLNARLEFVRLAKTWLGANETQSP